MAGRDYILCASCGCKIVYDGDDNGRDRMEQVWGDPSKSYWTVSLYCPECLQSLITERDAEKTRADKLEAELRIIADVQSQQWSVDMRDQFLSWAQNRARHALEAK